MIIAGAGGHGLEVLEILKEIPDYSSAFEFFDEDETLPDWISSLKVQKSLEDVKRVFEINPKFVLGVGNPSIREKFASLLSEIGGEMVSIRATTSVIQSQIDTGDVMSFGFIGPEVSMERGVLVNTRASVHHQCQVGEFTEIGPGAILLGKVNVGRKCRIGAGAILLPGITLEDEVVVGAGAVVTKNISKGEVVVGVPAKKLNQN